MLESEGRDTLHGVDAARDSGSYNVVHFTADNAPNGVPPGKYLVDDAGAIRYLVDPGINGVLTHRDPSPAEAEAAAKEGKEAKGAEVKKFDAPKARLMSLIIDGVLGGRLPWGLVLLGVFIAITLELAGVSSLPFAVGVYLPISASTPIFLGGMVRWLVDRGRKEKTAAESDSSGGVLLASGLIAGGAIAGMTLAIVAGASEEFSKKLNVVSQLEGEKGGFFTKMAGNDLAAIGLFAVLALFLYVVGREKVLTGKR